MVNAQGLRRCLQPSPVLRWHPWAPLVAALLLLGFVFVFGAQWGHSSAMRDRSGANSYAFMVVMEHDARYPARKLMRRARAIDEAVVRFVRDSATTPSVWVRVRNQAERWLFRGRAGYEYPRDSIVSLAEFRLRELSGSAAAWQLTAAYCDEMSAVPLTGMDLLDPAAASAYSTLLGRPISPEQLAPAVPNARCEPPRRVQ
ncbi:MAG TPA: hypothetical protein VM051_07215 [Usitatibacter sp.]|nr:hypothetical protein [Usitatibacter sp.]